MKLTLATRKQEPKDREDGTTTIGMSELLIIDEATGEEVENKTGFIWCSRSVLLCGESPLLTPEHLGDDPKDASYGVLIFRCDSAKTIIFP